MFISRSRRSRTLAAGLAESLGGKVHDCYMSFGGLGKARHCVKATFRRMAIEVYVLAPYTQVFVQNFRLRGARETVFSVNEPDTVMGLLQSVTDAFKDYGAPIFVMNGIDSSGATSFCRDPENEADITALGLAKRESLAITAHQILLRNKTCESSVIVARLETLSRVFERNGGPRASSSVSAKAYPIVMTEIIESERGDAMGPRHRFGGQLRAAIECRNCRKPAHLLLTLDVEDPLLDGLSLGDRILPVVHCLNCQVNSSLFSIRTDGNSWTLLEQEANQTFHDFPDHLEERQVKMIPGVDSGPQDVKNGCRKHKFGGAPSWVQGAEDPDCPTCGKVMRFLAQIDTDPRVGIQFGDDGLLYAFICPECRVISSFIQSG